MIDSTRASITLTVVLLFTCAATAFGQSAPPFDMIGFIQRATIDNPGNPLSGGFITINNHNIKVPANSIVQMPTQTLSWGQVFSLAPAAFSNAGTQTGMAMADSPRLPGTYEAHVQGNIVSGQYIAGLIFLSQESLNVGQGFIDSIDYVNGIIHVNGTSLKINDPLARFSKGDPNADPRFSIDETNATIRSQTGYPMCLPRTTPPAPGAPETDPLCPQKNRAKDGNGNLLMIYTMLPPGAPANQPDPRLQTPFEIGDYITYSGVISADESYLSVYQISDNVGIFTWPGSDPAYVAIDVLLQGTGGAPNPNFPQESTSKVKVLGFSTDPTRTVDIYARDTDCNGMVTTRTWVTGMTVEAGPPTVGVAGRFRYTPAGGTFLPPAREVLVKITGATNPTVANGLVAAQYYAPDFTFVFPANLTVGNPPVTLNLGDFVWLVNGIGPWAGGVAGQLNPWPDVTPPAKTCTPAVTSAPAPTASATANPATATPGQIVTLSGSGSTPTTGVTYSWTQAATDATQVALTNANSATATFNAPSVTASTVLNFTLKVANSAGSATASTTVTVNPNATVSAPIARATVTPTAAFSSTVVTLDGTGSTDTNSPAQPLSYAWTQTSGPAILLSNANTATATFDPPIIGAGEPSQTATFLLTVTNTSGLSATASVTFTINPVPDRILIFVAEYRTSTARLTVQATDTPANPNVVLTCTLDVINPATGKPYSAAMTPLTGGEYQVVFTGVRARQVTVTSSAGGSATKKVTVKQ